MDYCPVWRRTGNKGGYTLGRLRNHHQDNHFSSLYGQFKKLVMEKKRDASVTSFNQHPGLRAHNVSETPPQYSSWRPTDHRRKPLKTSFTPSHQLTRWNNGAMTVNKTGAVPARPFGGREPQAGSHGQTLWRRCFTGNSRKRAPAVQQKGLFQWGHKDSFFSLHVTVRANHAGCIPFMSGRFRASMLVHDSNGTEPPLWLFITSVKKPYGAPSFLLKEVRG